MAKVSQIDRDVLQMGRDHITQFLDRIAARLAAESGRLLEIGPQGRTDVRERFGNYAVDTFDLVDTDQPTYVGDITRYNGFLPDNAYDCVVCMDVIEHTLDPFGAAREIHRLLKHGGLLLISSPLNFRIHGPMPDCWRFTEHGFKVLLRDFEILEIDALETPGRDLFPLHYNVLARGNKLTRRTYADLRFRFID